jgi:NADH-quinone oxidoreductase subunit J
VTLNFFYFLSFLAILAAVMVVVSRNPVHSVLYLIITFFCIAGHYVLLNAQFLAIVHIIVYAGAIMVLFLYVIMLLNLNRESEPHKSTLLKIMATVCGGLLMIVIIGSLKGTENLVAHQVAATGEISLVKNLGKVMFSDFLIPFEVTSILLLAAMVGAVMLGKSESPEADK